MVDRKELMVIDEISKKSGLSQRDISAKTRMSLGAVNLILKRLASRGMIKTRNLNTKKVEYILTPKGFAEKAHKTYDYVMKTVGLVKQVKEEIAKIVLEEYNNGRKKFVILGGTSLADVIELALKGFDHERVDDVKDIKDDKVLVLIAEKKLTANGFRSINIAEKLSEVYWGVYGDEG